MKSLATMLLLAAILAVPTASAFAGATDATSYKKAVILKKTTSSYNSYSAYPSSYGYYPSTYSSSYSTCAQLYYCSNPGASYYASNYQYTRYSPGWNPSSQLYYYRPLPNTSPVRHTTGLDPNSQLYTTPTPAAATNNNSGSVGWDPNSQLYRVPTPAAVTNNNSGSAGWDADRQVLKHTNSRRSTSSRSTRTAPTYDYCDQILPGSQLDDGSC